MDEHPSPGAKPVLRDAEGRPPLASHVEGPWRVAELAILIVIWAAAMVVVWPRGNFPLHDDWDFALATWNFARTGHFHFTQFTAVSLRAQVLWGALWTKLFGQSFNVLRASTLALSLGTVILIDRTLARAQVARGMRMLAALALLFHPLFLWASCTYMTDVPYLFASAAAFYFFVRALQEERMAWLVAGCAAVVLAWFIRQSGVVLLGAPLALLILHRPKRWRSFVAVIAAFVALFAALLVFKREWLSGAPKMFAVHYHMWQESSFRLPEQIAVLDHYVIFNAQNCALFFLPLTLPLAALLARPRRGYLLLLAAIAAIVGFRIADLARAGYLVPYTTRTLYSDILPGNLFINFGIGTPLLMDTFERALPYPFALGSGARMLLTALSALLATLLVWALVRAFGGANLVLRLAILTVAIGTLALFASGYYYDRYSLDSAWAVCVALPMIIPWQKRLVRIAAVAALVLIAAFSALAVQEYFRWQRARWTAFDDLRARGVAMVQIDGGAEAFGFYELANAPVAVARRGHPPRDYAITFRPLDGYRVVARYPFRSFLGLRRGEIVALQKLSGTSG